MTANTIKVSIEVCIDADNEDLARQYAAKHGLDTIRCKWNGRRDGKGGRLYANDEQTISFPATAQSSAEASGGRCSAICNLMHPTGS